jgi:phosphate transport system substrate-binding protein
MSALHGRGLKTLLAGTALALVSAACGGGGSGGTSGDGEAVSGAVKISGSSTVEPISAANAEKFASVNPDVQMSVDGPGTGDGFELFCDGETDIVDASRPIDREEEIPLCEENGIEYIELKVGIDGITVLTSHDNVSVECLSFQDLYALLGPESEGFDNWSDADELGTKVGGSGDYPDAPLVITAPGEESGTYDSFAELVLEDIAVEQGISEDGPFVRSDYQLSADDNVIIQGIAENPTSLGWVGFAYYEQNTDTVKALPIEASEGEGCVEPTFDSIANGEYPIARDLYIYVDAAKVESNPALEAYVDFYLSDDGLATVSEVGYVDLPEESIEESRSVWEGRETGPRAE